jgi:hypothetical protein
MQQCGRSLPCRRPLRRAAVWGTPRASCARALPQPQSSSGCENSAGIAWQARCEKDADAIRADDRYAPKALVRVGRVHPHHSWNSTARGDRPHRLRRRRSGHLRRRPCSGGLRRLALRPEPLLLLAQPVLAQPRPRAREARRRPASPPRRLRRRRSGHLRRRRRRRWRWLRRRRRLGRHPVGRAEFPERFEVHTRLEPAAAPGAAVRKTPSWPRS